MDTGKIHYEKGKKFQLTRKCFIFTEVKGYNVNTQFCKLTNNGMLLVMKGFAWDGASGGFDTKRTIRASCAHDVLYKLMRLGILPRSEQGNADLTLRAVMRKDGASLSRAWAWFKAVAWFGRKNTDPKNKTKELVAP